MQEIRESGARNKFYQEKTPRNLRTDLWTFSCCISWIYDRKNKTKATKPPTHSDPLQLSCQVHLNEQLLNRTHLLSTLKVCTLKAAPSALCDKSIVETEPQCETGVNSALSHFKSSNKRTARRLYRECNQMIKVTALQEPFCDCKKGEMYESKYNTFPNIKNIYNYLYSEIERYIYMF